MQITFDAYRQRLAGLAKHPKVAGFLRWWLTELSASLPARWRSSGLDLSNIAVVQPAPHGMRVSRVETGRLVESRMLDFQSTLPSDQKSVFRSLLYKLSVKSDTITAALPAESVLVKKLRLPLAVEENLENVLAFEMDRHTPFKAEQVYFDYRIVNRDVQNQRMELELAVVPREAVERPVAQLAEWGITPAAVMLVKQDTLIEHFNLLPRSRDSQPTMLMGRRNRSLLALGVILAFGALLLPIVIKREAVLQLMPVVERAKQAAAVTDDLHRKLDALIAQHNFLLERKQTFPVLVVLLDELTRILPDDTWVQQFDLKGKELQIMGETGSSSKMIGLMEQSKILHDTNFRSPLTKGQTPGGERYHLGMEIKATPVNVPSAAPRTSAEPADNATTSKSPGAAPSQKQPDGEAAKTTAEPQPPKTQQEKG